VFCDTSHTTFAFCDLYHIDNFPYLAAVPDNPIYYFSNKSILPAQPGVDNCVERGVPVQPNEKTRIYKRASAGKQTFATTTARSKNTSAVGTDAVSFEQL
jgi:hypothetical protein